MKRAIHDLKRMDCVDSVPLPTHTGFIIKMSLNADKIIQILIILYAPLLPCTPSAPPKKNPNQTQKQFW